MKKILIIIMVCLSAISLLISIYFVYKSNQVSKNIGFYRIDPKDTINDIIIKNRDALIKEIRLNIETQNERMIADHFKRREKVTGKVLRGYASVISARQHIYKFYHFVIYFHLVLSVLFLAISLLLMFIPDNKPEKLQPE